MDKKVQVGQKVYIIDRRYSRKEEPTLKEAVVTKVGRVYFHVSIHKWDTERFRLEDFGHDNGGYTDRLFVYLSKQEYIDSRQASHLFGEIRKRLTGYNVEKTVDVDQLKQIAAILGIEELKL